MKEGGREIGFKEGVEEERQEGGFKEGDRL
jgi:hypothetical protein